jgi:hypothetical protein
MFGSQNPKPKLLAAHTGLFIFRVQRYGLAHYLAISPICCKPISPRRAQQSGRQPALTKTLSCKNLTCWTQPSSPRHGLSAISCAGALPSDARGRLRYRLTSLGHGEGE